MRIFSIMTLAFGMVMAVSCSKDEKTEDGQQGGGGDTPAATNPIKGHTFTGSMVDDYSVEFNYTITATDDSRMTYSLVTYYQGEELFTDEDGMTYTFSNNAGTMTFDLDGYEMNYTYNPTDKSISFTLYYNLQGLSVGGPVVLYQE